jgi:DNA mismatch repair protein MutS
MGSFVPVKTAKLGVVDRLFARIGASDNIVKQMSTFYVEMNETSHILANATSQSLILMDEIGRGTATNEGVALARSIVEYIHDSIECRTFLATHFHELNVLSQTLSKVSHYKVSAYKDENQNVIMSYLMEVLLHIISQYIPLYVSLYTLVYLGIFHNVGGWM